MTAAPIARPRIDFSAVLRTAWRVFAKHPVVWLLGMLMALLGRSDFGGTFNYGTRNAWGSLIGSTGSGPVGDIIQRVTANPLPYAIGGGIFLLLLWLAILLLGALVGGTLIAYVAAASRRENPNLRAAWAHGIKRMWALWLAAIVLHVIPLVALGALVACMLGSILAPLAGMTNATADSEIIGEALVRLGIFIVPLICIGVPAFIFFSMLASLTAPAVVLGERNAFAGIAQAFRLLFRHFGWVLLTWLILAAIGIGIAMLVAFPGFMLSVALTQASMSDSGSTLARNLLLLGTLGYTLIVGVGIGGVLTGFSTTLWTVLYEAMDPPQVTDAPTAPDMPQIITTV
jgi:hypothetical protein